MTLESPLIATQTGETGYMLRSLYTFTDTTDIGHDNWKDRTYFSGAGGRLGTMNEKRILMNCVKVYAADGSMVSSVIDAENLVISKATMVTEPWNTLPWGLRRQAAYLAARNRRGWPNGVLMHPSMAKKLEGENGGWVSTETGRVIGRWTEVGVMQKCGAVYVSEDMPEDEAVLFYNDHIIYEYHLEIPKWIVTRKERNGLDSAAVFLETEKGIYLIVSESDQTYPYGVDSYFCRVKMIENCV